MEGSSGWGYEEFEVKEEDALVRGKWRRVIRGTVEDSDDSVFGTVCHSTLRLHLHCLSSAAASRLTSLGAVSSSIFHSCIVAAQ